MNTYIIVTLIAPFLTGATFMSSLSTYLSLPIYLPTYLPVFIYLFYLSTHLSVLFVYPLNLPIFICLPILSIYLQYIPAYLSSSCCCSVAKSCLTFRDPMDCNTPGFPVLHYLPKFGQTHVLWVGDVIQPSHRLSSPSPPALNLSHHQGLFQRVSSLGKLLELQLQHQSYLPYLSTYLSYLPTYLFTHLPTYFLCLSISLFFLRLKYRQHDTSSFNTAGCKS